MNGFDARRKTTGKLKRYYAISIGVGIIFLESNVYLRAKLFYANWNRVMLVFI